MRKSPIRHKVTNKNGHTYYRGKGVIQFKSVVPNIKGRLDQDCYENSCLIEQDNPDLARYVGRAYNKATKRYIDHAWNVDLKGRVYDITLGSKRARKYNYYGKQHSKSPDRKLVLNKNKEFIYVQQKHL